MVIKWLVVGPWGGRWGWGRRMVLVVEGLGPLLDSVQGLKVTVAPHPVVSVAVAGRQSLV